jgi:hypothetical protein
LSEDPGKRRTLLCLTIDEAVQIDDFEKVNLVLNARADVNRASETGAYPLQLAVKNKRFQLTRDLLQRKADPDQQDEKLVSPLHLAAHADEQKIMQLLLLHKANVNATDKLGQPPLFFAGSRHCAIALLDAQADLMHLNSRGQSALHLAASHGDRDTLSYLTDIEDMQGMIDMTDERGRTPLHLAASRGAIGCISRLMDMGADARLKTNNGQDAMSLADAKDTEVAYYIYTRLTGSNKSTCGEMMRNPIALTMAAILGVASWTNRSLLWEFSWDIWALVFRR